VNILYRLLSMFLQLNPTRQTVRFSKGEAGDSMVIHVVLTFLWSKAAVFRILNITKIFDAFPDDLLINAIGGGVASAEKRK